MQNNEITYYTLRYERTDSLHKRGDSLVVPTGELRIGQQDTCGVKFPNNTDYEDEQYAIIRPTRNEGEWPLVPTSEFVKTFVNGMPIALVHYLNDDDRITFDCEDQELLFRVHRDSKFDPAKGIQVVAAPVSRKLIVFLILLPLVLFAWLWVNNEQAKNVEKERIAMLATLHSSVLQICVDSVLYVEVTSNGEKVIREYSYQSAEGHVVNGTAFLTSDSRIVTARHCVQPWLNDAAIYEADSPEDLQSLPTRWAMEAETWNQTQESDTIYKVVAICNLYRGQNGTEVFGRAYKSTEFEVDSTRDIIVEKGDFWHQYFWRSVKETPSNKDVMLGDVAWAKCDSIGGITLASDDQLTESLTAMQQLYFMGYPDYQTTQGFNTTEGKMQKDYVEGGMIVHGGDLIHGYSGAPAIVTDGKRALAVGVVSRIDANGGGVAYSVPVSQLKK